MKVNFSGLSGLLLKFKNAETNTEAQVPGLTEKEL
jgi:hypothetical protein